MCTRFYLKPTNFHKAMFIQTENPFGEMLAVAYSPITEFSYSNKTSNIWRIILGMIFLIGGVFVYFVLKQKK